MDDMPKAPFGSAVKTSEESAIAARRAIMQDDRKAVTLFIRAYALCMSRR